MCLGINYVHAMSMVFQAWKPLGIRAWPNEVGYWKSYCSWYIGPGKIAGRL